MFCVFWLLAFLWWRYLFFSRNPKRDIPPGNNIVSPADGSVVYIKKIKKGRIPLVMKKGKLINMQEITHIKHKIKNGWHIGIFMNPFSVHINRAPINGKTSFIHHFKHKDKSMIQMLFKVMLKKKSLPEDLHYLFENERNTIVFENKKAKFSVFVVQIADSIVNRVVCNKKKGDSVKKGEIFGMIKMGSQVDVFFPNKFGNKKIKIKVKEGQYIHAGETKIATY